MVSVTDLIPLLSFQLVILTGAMTLVILGSIKLFHVAIRLPKSQFKTVFTYLAVSEALMSVIMAGFTLAVAFRIGDDNLGNTIGTITSIMGIIGILLTIYSLEYMMKFLSAKEE